MGATLRSQILAGKIPDYSGAAPFATQVFESGVRRGRRLMCQYCLSASHSLCESETCPCVCNDSDFRFARRSQIETSDPDLAKILVVRPELRELFRL
jgi:hypothetical protein